MRGQRWSRILTSAGAAAVIAVVAATLSPAQRAAADTPSTPLSYTIDGSLADTNPGDAWKGFGAVTANNTSRYLLDYKDEHPKQYWQIMNELFNPVTGMGLTQVKVELGSDGDTSSGTEPATMRTADDVANVLRGAGFHFAADAKSINPAVQVSLLNWSRAAWITTNAQRFQWYKDTIDSAYKTYGLVVNWIDPNTNETSADVPWITYFAQQLKAQTGTPYDYSKIKIAMDDSTGSSSTTMANNLLTLIDPGTLSAAQKAAAATPSADPQKALAQALDPANANTLWTTSYPNDADGVKAYYYRVANQTLLSLVSALAHHYDIYTGPAMAILNRTYGMQIWYAEGVTGIGNSESVQHLGLQATGQTAIDVANLFINSYAGEGNSTLSGGYPTDVKDAHHTLYMTQPAVEAFPQGTTYSSKSDITADSPWSGTYTNQIGYYITRQLTAFASTGTVSKAQVNQPDAVPSGAWQYVDGDASRGTGHESSNAMSGSTADRLTLENRQHTQFSTIVTNNSDQPATYTVTVKNVKLDTSRLAVYETDFASGAKTDSHWFQRDDDIALPGSGTFTFAMAPYSVKTITSLPDSKLPAAHKPGSHTGPEDAGVLDYRHSPAQKIVYQDDFEYAKGSAGYSSAYAPQSTSWDYTRCEATNTDTSANACSPTGPKLSYLDRRGNTPRYSNDMNGAFEVNNAGRGHALVQQLTYDQIPGAWNPGPPETLIGDDKWANYTASADVQFDTTTPASASYKNYVGIGGRSNRAGNGFLLLLQADGDWGIMQDAGNAGSIGNGVITASNSLAHGFITGFDPAKKHTVGLTMKGQTVVASVDGKTLAQWTATGANVPMSGRVHLVSGWYRNAFDDLTVSAVRGYTATLTKYIDDGDNATTYSGTWQHSLGSSSILDRTQSVASAGASVTVPFTGTGFVLDAGSAQSDHIDVKVDGHAVATDVAESTKSPRESGYRLTGLRNGRHTVTITSVDGGFGLDAVGVYGAVTPGVDRGNLAALIAKYDRQHLTASDYSADSWGAYSAALATAKTVLHDSAADQDAIDTAASALQSAHEGLQALALQSIKDSYVTSQVGIAPTLPATVTPVYGTGPGTAVPVTWDLDGIDWNSAGTHTVFGHGTDGDGQPFATAKAVVTVDAVTAVDPSSVTVPAGTSVSAVVGDLPATVKGQLGMTSDRLSLPVTWNPQAITATQLAASGSFTVDGTAKVAGGASLPAALTVIVVGQSEQDVCTLDKGVTVSATYTEPGYSAAATCDGDTSSSKRWSDWVSGDRSSDSLTYGFTHDYTISSITVYSSEKAATSFTVQYQDAGGAWVDTDAGTTTGLSAAAPSTATFSPVTTDGIRVVFAFSPAGYTKINEVQIFGLATQPSSVDTLGELEVNNAGIAGFAAGTNGYTVQVDSLAALPTVSALPTDQNAAVAISQASLASPVATVTVTAADGSTNTYTVAFTSKQSPDYVYYIDSGATRSDAYDAIAAQSHLLNAVPDQAYVPGSSTWGYDTADPAAVTGSPSDPQSSYRSTNDYYLTLPAGTYQVSVGYASDHAVTALSTVYDDSGTALAPTVSTQIAADSTPTATSTITLDRSATVALNTAPASGSTLPRIAWVSVVVAPPAPALKSITVTPPATDHFTQGQPVLLTGTKVTARFADGSTSDVTADAVYAPLHDLSSPGVKTGTVSYSSGGTTVHATLRVRIDR
ncbi:Ig-like domain-containing protein [Humibacter ginsengisoli]